MTDRKLSGRVAVVTGASLGIGRATALRLAAEGAAVTVNYRSNADQAQEVVETIQRAGGRATALQADVASYEALEEVFQRTVAEFGRVDIAVSNAAWSDREIFYEGSLEGFRRTIDVTMWGAFHTLRLATLQMIRQGEGGAIVLVSSPHAFIPAPKAMAYNMSKAAIEHMARTAAIEVAEHRIRVNIIQPGWTDTPGELKFASRETLDTAGAKIPLGRLGTPEEMAEGILFLCDPGQSYLTGAALLIDGGISLPWWANRGSAAPG